MFPMKRVIIFALLLAGLGLLPLWASNDNVQGYPRPKVCMETGIRCILRELNGQKYWCLKSSIQRELDSRYNSHPVMTTTQNNKMGNCAKLLPIKEGEVSVD